MITPGPSPSIGPKIQDGAHLTVGLSVHLGSLTNAKAIFLHFRDSKKDTLASLLAAVDECSCG